MMVMMMMVIFVHGLHIVVNILVFFFVIYIYKKYVCSYRCACSHGAVINRW